MNSFRSIVVVAIATAILAACAGETQLQSNVGFNSAPPANSSPIVNNGAFPQECFMNGQLALKEEPSCYGKGDKRYCSESSVLCTCVGKDVVVRWARLKSADNGNPQYGYCSYRAPDPGQVDRTPIGVPPAASSSALAVPPPVQPSPPPVPSASASAAPVNSVGPVPTAPPGDASQLSGTPTCAMKENVLTCRVLRVATSRNAEPTKETSCVGGNYVPLSSDALAKYDGKGAPCTCAAGTLKKMNNPPNTWWCDTGK